MLQWGCTMTSRVLLSESEDAFTPSDDLDPSDVTVRSHHGYCFLVLRFLFKPIFALKNWIKKRKERGFVRGIGEDGKITYCGFSPNNWFVLVLFTLAFYSCLALITVSFYLAFKAAALDDETKIPHRVGYRRANSMIDKKRMSDIPKFLEFYYDTDVYLGQTSRFESKLSFPVLSHVPSRYSGDDADEDEERSKKYRQQMDHFQSRAWPYNQTIDDVAYLRCTDSDFAEQRLHLVGNATVDKKVIMESSCHVDKSEWFQNGFCSWYNIDIDRGQKFEPAGSSESQKVCFFVKLNNIIGYYPMPMPTKDVISIVEELEDNRKNGETLVVAAREELITEGDSFEELTHVKLMCWHNVNQTDFISFRPGAYLAAKHLPFLGQRSFTQPATLMQLDFSRVEIDNVKIECRSMALNAGYDEIMPVLKKMKHGHFTLKIAYRKGPPAFFKILQ